MLRLRRDEITTENGERDLPMPKVCQCCWNCLWCIPHLGELLCTLERLSCSYSYEMSDYWVIHLFKTENDCGDYIERGPEEIKMMNSILKPADHRQWPDENKKYKI